MELKNAICDSVGYDKNQMSSFFLCNDRWEKEKEITMEDMGDDAAVEVYLMDDEVLADFIDDEGQKLLFTFDYMTDRSMFIEMKEMIPGQDLHEPLCALSRGKAPKQLMDFEEFEAKTEAKAKAAAADAAELDEDFYGSESYNEDEFDADGFDEMTFDDK